MPGTSPRRVNQIKGILLEEVVLRLLESSGYRVVTAIDGDPTLSNCSAGIQVCGRGAEHQIDAIADYIVLQPFTYPQRLLVEAKSYANKDVDLEIVRNALGVFRDVAEYWTSPPGAGLHSRRRYHYQYAVFATSNFTIPAQRFAYAHDIHLLPLGQSTFFGPVTWAIQDCARLVNDDMVDMPLTLSDVRATARALLRNQESIDMPIFYHSLKPLKDACDTVGEGYLAMAGGVFPLFLIPASDVAVEDLRGDQVVRIGYRDNEWHIRDSASDRILFSFDLPEALFDLYAESGALSRESALALKAQYFEALQFVSVRGGVPRIITLRMDAGWFRTVQEQSRRRNVHS